MFARCGTQDALAGFDGGSTGIVELKTVQIARQYIREFFNQTRLCLGSKIMAVHQSSCSLLHGLSHLRMTMSESGYVDAGGKVNIPVAVNINQLTSFTIVKSYRKELDLAAQPLEILRASSMKFPGFGAWESGLYVGNLV